MINIKSFLFTAAIFLFTISPFPASGQLLMPTMNNATIESMVQEAFATAPEMIDIAKCESGMRQYRNDGSILRGGTGGNYIGIFQIGTGHAPTATNLGMDIYTAEGNIAYAKYMYERQGNRPWASCVKPASSGIAANPFVSEPSSTLTPPFPTPNSSTLNLQTSALSLNLKIGMSHPQVKILQQILNATSFTITPSGPGSPGNETYMFGSLTREAVRKFQCSKNIACSGNEVTTGWGNVGPRTRAALQSLTR